MLTELIKKWGGTLDLELMAGAMEVDLLAEVLEIDLLKEALEMDLLTGALETDSLGLNLNRHLIVLIIAKDLNRVMRTSFLPEALEKIEILTGVTKIKDLAIHQVVMDFVPLLNSKALAIAIMIMSLETALKVKVSAISLLAEAALLDDQKVIAIAMKLMTQEVLGSTAATTRSITEDNRRQTKLEIRVMVFRGTKDTKIRY